jgi:hypothetical protein
MNELAPLPARLHETREALRAVACYVVAPARKARDQHIGLVPVAGGFGTPSLDDGAALVVQGDRLRWLPGDGIELTTLRAAAEFAEVEPSSDPGVGRDLPPLRLDDPLLIDVAASTALGAWWSLGAAVLEAVGHDAQGFIVGAAQLWPEHFDLAAVATLDGGAKVNLGFSPGDSYHADPYVYVGPHDMSGLTGEFWNAPFGAVLGYDEVRAAADPASRAVQLLRTGLQHVR